MRAFAGALDIFRPCASSLRCWKTNSHLMALEHVFRRALRCGGSVPEKSPMHPPKLRIRFSAISYHKKSHGGKGTEGKWTEGIAMPVAWNGGAAKSSGNYP
jgi:hypothetical protein